MVHVTLYPLALYLNYDHVTVPLHWRSWHDTCVSQALQRGRGSTIRDLYFNHILISKKLRNN